MNNFKNLLKHNLIISVVGGTAIGFVNGFFGSGGGMLVVPLLTLALKQKDKTAHATAIFIILPLSIASSVVYITSKAVNMSILVWVAIGVLVGGIVGALFLKCVNNNILRIVFAVIMVIAGIKFVI